MYPVVARNAFGRQSVQNTWLGPLLEVEMSKKCTPLWCETQFQVEMRKTRLVRTIFGRSDLVSRGRREGLCTVSQRRENVDVL